MAKELEEIDHVNEAEANFLGQYKDSYNFVSFVNAFLAPLNDLETELQKFAQELPLNKAEKVNLDYYFDILNLQALSVNEDEKRSRCYTYIGAYNSEGTAGDVINLASNLMDADEVKLIDALDGTFFIEVNNPKTLIDEELVINSVRLAKPIGVTFTYILLVGAENGEYFAFTDDLNAKAKGFAVLDDPNDRSDDAPTSGGGGYAVLYNSIT